MEGEVRMLDSRSKSGSSAARRGVRDFEECAEALEEVDGRYNGLLAGVRGGGGRIVDPSPAVEGRGGGDMASRRDDSGKSVLGEG